MTTQTRTGSVESMFEQAKAGLEAGTLTPAELDALRDAALAPGRALRQRLLYLHVTTISIHSGVISATLHEPVAGHLAQMDPLQQDPGYNSVHEAIRDGWRVIHFPQQNMPFDDVENDILGYEFILEKLEHFHG